MRDERGRGCGPSGAQQPLSIRSSRIRPRARWRPGGRRRGCAATGAGVGGFMRGGQGRRRPAAPPDPRGDRQGDASGSARSDAETMPGSAAAATLRGVWRDAIRRAAVGGDGRPRRAGQWPCALGGRWQDPSGARSPLMAWPRRSGGCSEAQQSRLQIALQAVVWSRGFADASGGRAGRRLPPERWGVPGGRTAPLKGRGGAPKCCDPAC